MSASNILGLDVGDVRIGVATANTVAKLPGPLAIINNDEQVLDNLLKIIRENSISLIVIGLPRNMKGEETPQTQISRQFAARLSEVTQVRIEFADESLSSKRAEAQNPDKKHVDDIAACFILEEYLRGSQ